MTIRFLIFCFWLLAAGRGLRADEGMWIPALLHQLNIRDMQAKGLKLSAEEIYSVNNSSLKDAIVQFGGGCTGVIVSEEGLLLTNHHCALGTIQRHSTPEHDYLRNGFWASEREEELPNPGLTVTLLVRMEEVTDRVLKGTDPGMSMEQRSGVIRKNSDSLEKAAVQGTHYEARVRSFFYGNQYYLIVNEVFRDIRLAGAPPHSIGQFGGDTDNWMWPRHGGDFTLFRIYADSNNRPASYSKNNVPYRPKKVIRISLKGYRPGDFTFVFGYPGGTREYLTSMGMDLVANRENPVRIRLRGERLSIINRAMENDNTVRIQYTSKHQGIANGWKKMIGETKGVTRMDAIGKKQVAETDYSGLMEAFGITYEQYTPTWLASVWLNEAGLGIEAVRFAGNFRELVKLSKQKDTKPEEIAKAVDGLKRTAAVFYKDYYPPIDREVMAVMLREIHDGPAGSLLPELFAETGKKWKDDFASFSADVFSRSLFTDSIRLYPLLKSYRKKDHEKLEKDPVYRMSSLVWAKLDSLGPVMKRFGAATDSLQRIYMAALMEMQPQRVFYPDANSTLRISYGRVEGYTPADGAEYNYFTTTEGILQKEDTAVYDYRIDPRLKKIFREKDFGRWADPDGTLHTAFIATNHTTGGNSGSPVLDAEGNLIGLNFDRCWEGTMSDLAYDPAVCRNIALDIRYCLFIIDRFAGAGNFLKEMNIE